MEILKRFLRAFRPREERPSQGDRSHGAKLDDLQAKIGYRFNDEKLLLRALKHRSYVHSKDQGVGESNERLEFLGDAVLSLVVSDYLYRMFPTQREGGLARVKSMAVSKSTLSKRARQIGLGKYLLLSGPEKLAGGSARPSITGDAYEALLGAIYLDGGLKAVTEFLEAQLLNDLQRMVSNGDHQNCKSVLLEYAQQQGKGQPRYILKTEEGPDHRKTFTIEVAIGGEKVGRGTGRSKKQAEQMAAQDTLRRLGIAIPTQQRTR